MGFPLTELIRTYHCGPIARYLDHIEGEPRTQGARNSIEFVAWYSPKPLNIRSEASSAELCEKRAKIETFTPNGQKFPWIYAIVLLGTYTTTVV